MSKRPSTVGPIEAGSVHAETMRDVCAGEERERLLALEGLRGVLALVVCAGHFGLNTLVNRLGLQVRFSLAVDLFFVLSGFVLCYSSYFGRKALRAFVVSRFARLYPLHAITLAAVLAMSSRLGLDESRAELTREVLLLHSLGWSRGLPLNMPSWSLSVEMWVSLGFFFLLRERRVWPLLCGASLLFFVSAGVGDYHPAAFLSRGALRGICGFSAGCLVYAAYDRFRGHLRVPPALVYGLSIALLACFLAPRWSAAINVGFYLVAGSLVLALAVAGSVTLFASGPAVFLGKVSYSVYLVHMPVLYLLGLIAGDAVRGPGKLAVLGFVIALSALTYRWVERPLQRWTERALGRERLSEADGERPREAAA